MRYNFHCPACDKEFSFLRLINKFYILRPRCPHCRSTLQVLNMGIYTFFMMLLFGGVAVLYMQRQMGLGQPINFLVPILLVLLYEVLVALLICNKGTLAIRTNRHISKTDEFPQ